MLFEWCFFKWTDSSLAVSTDPVVKNSAFSVSCSILSCIKTLCENNTIISQLFLNHTKMPGKIYITNFSDYSKGFGGKFGVQTDRKDASAVGYDHQEKLEQHESQKGEVL